MVAAVPVYPFYVGAKYVKGTIACIPINALLQFSKTSEGVMTAILAGHTQLTNRSLETVVVVDSDGAIASVHGDNKYVAGVAATIRSCFFPNGKPLMGQTMAPSQATAQATVIDSLYRKTTTYPIHSTKVYKV